MILLRDWRAGKQLSLDDKELLAKHVELQEDLRDKSKKFKDLVVVFNPVSPARPQAFLLHLVLSQGHFTTGMLRLVIEMISNLGNMSKCVLYVFTEWGLLKNPMRKVFVDAQLCKNIDMSEPLHVREAEARKIFRRWVNSEHLYSTHPQKRWTMWLEMAWDVIWKFVVEDKIEYNESPPVLIASLVKAASEVERTALANTREVLATALFANGCHKKGSRVVSSNPSTNGDEEDIEGSTSATSEFDEGNVEGSNSLIFAADEEKVLNCEVQDWYPVIEKAPGQSDASFAEQNRALKEGISSINNYINGEQMVHGPVLIGPPGAGKTFLFSLCCMYAMVKALRVYVVALTAERAMEMGGSHLHQFFSLREPSGTKMMNAQRMANRACADLQRSPAKLAIIRTMHVLAIEEIGVISREMMKVLDLILQRLRKSVLPFGGVLVLATGDPRQLQPVQGYPAFLMPNLLYDLKPLVLKEYVRCAEDLELQRLLRLIQLVDLEPAQIQEVEEILKANIHPENVHLTTDTLPAGCHFVVPTRKASTEISKQRTRNRRKKIEDFNRRNPNNKKILLTNKAVDYCECTRAQFQKAGRDVTRDLNLLLVEPEELFISEGEVYRFTCNDKSLRFTQGQLCMIKKVHPASSEFDLPTV